MERIQLAERLFEQLVADSATKSDGKFSTRELLVWLRDDVCALIEEFSRRPRFRENATWPLRNLVKGAASAERQLIDRIEMLLVENAKTLLALASKQRVKKILAATHGSIMVVQSETVGVTGSGVRRVEQRKGTVDHAEIKRSQLEWIARRPWTDLVCPADYFEPTGDWSDTDSIANDGQAGDFVVCFNPELHFVGDFVTRCMMHRIHGICDTIKSFRRMCLAAARKSGERFAARIDKEHEIWNELTTKISELDSTCLVGRDTALRHSCIILTQTYAAFARSPDLQWLGLPEIQLGHGVLTLRHRVEKQQDRRVLNRIAAALRDLGRLYDESGPQQSEMEEAIASGGLVVISNRPEGPVVYWDGKQIDQDWLHYRKRWALLEKLAKKARHGAAVADRDLFEENSLSALSTTVGRLKLQLPSSLRELIRSVHGTRTYRLNLDSNRIFVF